MKNWFITFTAVLFAGGVLFAWQRTVIIWEGKATLLAGQLEADANRSEGIVEMADDNPSLKEQLSMNAVLLESAIEAGKHQFAAFAPLRDDSRLSSALISASTARMAVHDKSQVLAAADELSRNMASKSDILTLEGWTEISNRYITALKELHAPIPTPSGENLVKQHRQLRITMLAAKHHLMTVPGWADREPLQKTLDMVSR